MMLWARRNLPWGPRPSCSNSRVAGESSRAEVNATFVQPFVTYTTKTFTTFGFNTETTYDWENEQGTVPLNWFVQQLLKIGPQPALRGVEAACAHQRGGPGRGPGGGFLPAHPRWPAHAPPASR